MLSVIIAETATYLFEAAFRLQEDKLDGNNIGHQRDNGNKKPRNIHPTDNLTTTTTIA